MLLSIGSTVTIALAGCGGDDTTTEENPMGTATETAETDTEPAATTEAETTMEGTETAMLESGRVNHRTIASVGPDRPVPSLRGVVLGFCRGE